MKTSILFYVKDPKDVPDFREFENDWTVAAAANSDHAIQALAHKPFEVVVTDTSSQTGSEVPFLTQVTNRFPQLIRIVVCSPADKKSLKSDGSVHQYVFKPFTAELLISAVQRARLVNLWLQDPALKRLFTQMRKLPSVPSVYFRLVQKMQSPDTGVEDIGSVITEDPGLTAKILQLVNSPFFGLGRTISHPGEAVSYVGIERTKALVLLAHSVSNFVEDKSSPFSVDRLWRHSMATAQFAREICRQETGDKRLAEEAFTAGVLHDIGKLMLAANLPQEFKAAFEQSHEKKITLAVSERKGLGATHAEIGGCVLGIWGLPASIVTAIAFHHRPDQHSDKTFSPLTAVHVANALEHELHPDKEDCPPEQVDRYYLEELGLQNRLDAWREACQATIEASARN